MVVKVTKKIEFPNTGWLTHRGAGPQNGRYLLEVRGRSGMSSWAAGLLTLPESALGIQTKERRYGDSFLGGVEIEHFYHILPGTYEVQEGQDKRGQRLLRFYVSEEKTDYVLFATPGCLVPEASSEGVQALLECEGRSRTRQNGNRWALIAAPVGAIVAVEPYASKGDPIYYRVSEDGIEELGATDAVLAPDEW